jgi:hypothetical protein
MVPVERPKTNEKFASREKIRKWKTGLTLAKRPPDCRLKCLENNKPIVLFVHNMCLCINLSAQIVDILVVIVIVVHLL